MQRFTKMSHLCLGLGFSTRLRGLQDNCLEPPYHLLLESKLFSSVN